MKSTTTPENQKLIWLAVFAPIVLCMLTVIAGTSLGAAYLYNQDNTIGATSSAVYALNAQRRLTQTSVQVTAQVDRLTQTAAAVIKITDAAPPPATAEPSETPRPTASPTLGANVGFGTITFKECRGKEGAVFFGNNPPQSLHSNQSVTFNNVPAGTYKLKVDFPGDTGLNFDGEIQVRAGIQVIPFGDQCK